MEILVLCIAFGASIVGAICGIGGGVIIKPLLDAFEIASVAEISFLSGCTVLSMSCYSVVKALAAKESLVKFQTGTPLAIGAAIGGILGKNLFSMLRAMAAQPERVGGYQAVCLAIVTAATLVYTLNKKNIRTMQVANPLVCIAVGLTLGIMSSFLGIGGGPINLVVLFFFFSMDTKTAAENSLYIILVSQIASLLASLLTRTVPEFSLGMLLLMAAGGICGGICGRSVNKKLESRRVDQLFIGFMIFMIFINLYNIYKFVAL